MGNPPDSNVVVFPGAQPEEGVVLRPEVVGKARQAYLAQRRAGEGVERALGRVGERAADLEVELPLQEVAAGWERQLAAERSEPALASRAVDLRARLEDVLDQVAVSRSVLEQATTVVEGPPPWGWGPKDGLWPSATAILNWRSARNDWLRLVDKASELGEAVARLDREVLRVGHWETVYADRLDALKSEYSGGGPQYDLLVEALASLDTRIKQMESSGRDVPAEEYQKLSELRLKYISQIQKHTESLKSESVQPVQNAINKLMQELEREIKPSNPAAWEDIVKTTVRAVQKHGLGLESVA